MFLPEEQKRGFTVYGITQSLLTDYPGGVGEAGPELKTYNSRYWWPHYWGMTCRAVVQRIEEHLGVYDRQGRDRSKLSLSERMKRGWTTPQLKRLIADGCDETDDGNNLTLDCWSPFEVVIMASGLSRAAAGAKERDLIEQSHAALVDSSCVNINPGARPAVRHRHLPMWGSA